MDLLDKLYDTLMTAPPTSMLVIDATGHDLIVEYKTPSQINLENTVISMS